MSDDTPPPLNVDEAFARVLNNFAIVHEVMNSDRDLRRAVVVLAAFVDQLNQRCFELEGLAPRKYRLPDGRVMGWQCPWELVPTTDLR